MEEFEVSESKVLEIFGKVSMAKKEAGMELMDKDFGHQKRIQKIKKQNFVLVRFS